MPDLSCHSALLLASGLSRRYGPGNKLLAGFDGLPLAGHAARLVGAAGFGRMIAVIDQSAAKMAALVEAEGLEVVRNPTPSQGQGASLALGASVFVKDPPGRGLFVFLADMPRVQQGDILRLAEVFAPDDVEIAIAHNGICQLPPAVFAPSVLPALARLSGDRGAKAIPETPKAGRMHSDPVHSGPMHSGRTVREVPLAPDHLIDLDVRDDFARYRSR